MNTAATKAKKPITANPPQKASLGSAGKLSSLLKRPTGTPEAAGAGKPIRLALNLIDRDPNQPRTVFDPEKLAELTASVKLRGVKSPISVRPHPEVEGRYMINHGERRKMASEHAGFTDIPAFIDSDYTDDDQVIENIQRDGLTAREIANYIDRKLKAGMKKGEIATNLGVSAAFVSQHATLLDLPDPISAAFNSGRVTDLTLVNELAKAFKTFPLEVTDLLDREEQEITRTSVKKLREFWENYREQEKNAGQDADTPEALAGSNDSGEPFGAGEGSTGVTQGESFTGDDGLTPPPSGATEGSHDDGSQPNGAANEDDGPGTQQRQQDPMKLKKAIVQIRHHDRPARLMLDKRPGAEGLVWIKYDDDGQEREIAADEAALVALVEGS